ncbi:MAG: hypothetical protein ACJ8H8_17450 [Geminicoccaceae bacterium]
MSPALKAALHRLRSMLLAVAAGGAVPLGGVAHGAIEPGQQETSPADQAAWTEAQKARTTAAYQRYLELFPVGNYAEEAFRRLIESSYKKQPVTRLIDVEPPLQQGGPLRRRVVAAAALSLY